MDVRNALDGMQQLHTSASVTIFTRGASENVLPSKETLHWREVQASGAQPPATYALDLVVPLLDTALTRHCPTECSMHMPLSPRLAYTTRPSAPFSCVGSKKPLIEAAKTPVAPLMNTGTARALSAATALASAAACSAPCEKTKSSERKQRKASGEGGYGVRAGSSSQPDAALQHQPPSSQEVRLKTFCRRKKPSTGVKCRLQLRSRPQHTRGNKPCLC